MSSSASLTASLFPDLTWQEYRAIEALNWSLLKEIFHSPGKLAWRLDNPWEGSPAATKGSAIDCLITRTPEEFAREYTTAPMRPEELPDGFVMAPEGYTGRTKDDKAWRADVEAAGKTVVTASAFKAWGLDFRTDAGKAWKQHMRERGVNVLSASDMSDVRGAARAVSSYPLARELLDASEHQVAVLWQDKETGIWCKGLMDAYAGGNEPMVVDLKSTGQDVGLDMGRLAFTSGWHRQLGMYCDGCEAATGIPHDRARIIAVEQSPPHRVEVFELAPSVLEQGREEWRAALRAYDYCQRNNRWPTSSGELQTLTLPGWATR